MTQKYCIISHYNNAFYFTVTHIFASIIYIYTEADKVTLVTINLSYMWDINWKLKNERSRRW